MAASQPSGYGTSDEDAPPSYESINHAHRVQHVDSEAWRDMDPNLVFGFISPLGGGDTTTPNGCQWEVRLRVKVRDLPRLMVEGFHWDASNFNFNATYYKTHVRDEQYSIIRVGWSCSSHFFLSDLGDNPYWAATLIVFAHNTDVLSNFRVTDVTPDNLRWAAAWTNGGEGVVYDWESDNPLTGINSIYPNLPLKGWWPWPKRND
ncbi:hypothetical protein CkaCkLH20_02385 [Colletotrichum karsti]|uniref:Uncharacterized protein n=1 Tax=Colletotrichum karsti TaxID=1095194 RepID=A0A9P6IGX5_9PEZI|nr:uncharacterized protein CkaCkLH20_02385 [Colletotrichum karsti]KAF9880431.1 hypothetical protein CkaCkLH20_02385 [Colletotrichum karsti]